MPKFLSLFLLLLLFRVSLSEAQEKKSFSHESEASIVNISGNTQTENYLFKQSTEYKLQKELLNIKGRYLRTKNLSTEIARLWDLSLRYEKEISLLWSYFIQQGAESDPYAGFTQRDNSDIGAKYFFIKNAPEVLFLEGGYRYSKILSSLNNEVYYKNSARFYAEYTNNLSEEFSGKIWLEYLADINDPQDYLVNYEPSISLLVSQTFSIKISYLVKIHNKIILPEEKKADTAFTTTLVIKL